MKKDWIFPVFFCFSCNVHLHNCIYKAGLGFSTRSKAGCREVTGLLNFAAKEYICMVLYVPE